MKRSFSRMFRPAVDRECLVFVLSARRSGSTLMYNILCRSPDTHPFARDAEFLSRLLDTFAWGETAFQDKVRYYFPSLDDFFAYQKEMADRFIASARRSFGASKCLVIKSPELSPHASRLVRLFPQAKFIVVRRDPRDQILSEYEVSKRQMSSGMLAALPSIEALCQRYDTCYSAIEAGREKRPDDFLVIRYEDLVRSPVVSIRSIEQFIGINLSDFDPKQKWNRSGMDWEAKKKLPSWSDNYGKPVTQASVGRFRSELQQADIDEIERNLGHWMSEFGYASSGGPD